MDSGVVDEREANTFPLCLRRAGDCSGLELFIVYLIGQSKGPWRINICMIYVLKENVLTPVCTYTHVLQFINHASDQTTHWEQIKVQKFAPKGSDIQVS